MILNRPIKKKFLLSLFKMSSFVCCADGGANRIYDLFGSKESENFSPDEERQNYIPHVIIGDFDSVRPEVLKYYEKHGSKIVKVES